MAKLPNLPPQHGNRGGFPRTTINAISLSIVHMIRDISALFSAVLLTATLVSPLAHACSSMMVTRGATMDGSTMVTYNADAQFLYGELRYTPADRHMAGIQRKVIDWETGELLGRIPEVPATYAVVGNMNERQLTIAESSFTARKELTPPSGMLDYGSLIFIALERTKTAREAILLMTRLAAEHGYSSYGESFSIADPNEAWLMEMIGKGVGNKGAVWVARRLPEGTLTASANHARITQFPLNDPDNTLYSPDVISFAREKGWYSGADKDFSFADVYNPFDFDAYRLTESRVWSIFRRAAPSLGLGPEYVDGSTLDKRLPLWVKPDRKLSAQDVMALIRDHFEDTPFDMSKDIGAGPYGLPYRWRPLWWDIDGKKYFNERALSTQQTAFSFVAQMRGWLPDAVGGLLWFGFDDTALTVYTPMYVGIRKVPKNFAEGVADRGRFSWDSSFWVFNWVSSQAYARWSDVVVDVQKEKNALEGGFFASQAEVEKTAVEKYKQNPEAARNYLTEYSVRQGDKVHAHWRKFGEELFVKYLDGNVREDTGKINFPRPREAWYRAIVRDTGRRLERGVQPAVTPP
ncbi:C69 family dipeptidase [Ramlibacter sp.]|uniref:dipeptidase n=1 Tax=Ramlibacter sp. TaxID=1917967 RepID=UPI0025EA7D6A|nr:C69 family dipeptidase [Ramlibacter sp.]